jgi:hypothetical protein
LESKEAEIKNLSVALNSYQQQHEIVPKFEEDAIFFKSKLLEAERYIEEMEHGNIINQQILRDQGEELKKLGARVVQL